MVEYPAGPAFEVAWGMFEFPGSKNMNGPRLRAVSLSRLAPSVTRVAICVSRVTEKRDTARSLEGARKYL